MPIGPDCFQESLTFLQSFESIETLKLYTVASQGINRLLLDMATWVRRAVRPCGQSGLAGAGSGYVILTVN